MEPFQPPQPAFQPQHAYQEPEYARQLPQPIHQVFQSAAQLALPTQIAHEVPQPALQPALPPQVIQPETTAKIQKKFNNQLVRRAPTDRTAHNIWKIFSFLEDAVVSVRIPYVICDICNKVYKYTGNIGIMKRHKCALVNLHDIYVNPPAAEQYQAVPAIPNKKPKEEVPDIKEKFIELCTNVVTQDLIPPSFVTGAAFLKLAQALIKLGAEQQQSVDIKNVLSESDVLSQNLEKRYGAYGKKLKQFAEERVRPQVPEGPRDWKCPECTYLNKATCYFCGYDAKPDEAYFQNSVTTVGRSNYQELIDMENVEIVVNLEPFECTVCYVTYKPGEGVILRDCLHSFCKPCLVQTIQYSTEAEVKCPYRDDNFACDITLQDREVRALVPPEVYEQYLAKSVKEAESKMQNTFHCKTADCQGWCIYEDEVNEFLCPVCNKTNCLTCQAVHTGLNCKQYQEIVAMEASTNPEIQKTKEMLQKMLMDGCAMNCPTCRVIIMKKIGCDWLRCSMCKTEICWVTKGPRWGPKGPGDTSGGCRCMVQKKKCNPKCRNCH